MNERLKTLYKQTVRPDLFDQFHYKNSYQIPKLKKIVINRGIGSAQNSNILENSMSELSLIAGQKGIITRSKKAIAAFKLRAKTPVGICIVLRGNRMYAFLDRLISLALPRIRDFQGLNPRSFDGSGNYNLGLEEQLMFPEINYDKIDQVQGLDISIVTTTSDDKHAFHLLKGLGMPFQREDRL